MPGPDLIALAAVLLLTSPSPVPVAGRVIRVRGADTIAVARGRVILHRVTADNPGPIDSMLTDAQGRFTFQVTPDSGAVYLTSARWDGIEYFGPAMALDPDTPTPDVIVTVSDTSSRAPIQLRARHLIVSPVGADGSRSVVDLMVLDNPGTLTRILSDSAHPVWRVRLPPYAFEVHAGNSDFALQALQMQGDTVGVYAAIPPGERDLEVDYQIPAHTTRFVLPIDEGVAVSNIISQDKGMHVGSGFVRNDTVIDGKPYARWQGALHAGDPLVLEFGTTSAPAWLVPLLVALMLSVLGFGTWRAWHLQR